MKMSTKRMLCALAVVAAVCVGLAVHTGTGTPSSWGIGAVAALCPLGALEAAIAAKTVVPPMFIGLGIAVVAVVLLGRAFCAWGCPVPLLRRLFGVDRRKAKARSSRKEGAGDGAGDGAEAGALGGMSASANAPASAETLMCGQGQACASSPDGKKRMRKRIGKRLGLCGACGALDISNAERGGAHDARNWVLGGVLLSTAAFGFPVFCLICPVGLTFATVIMLWRAIEFGVASAALVVFPAILVVEVVVLRTWCHRLCPLGALMSLIARLNRTLRPTIDAQACLHATKRAACMRCAQVCPEGINLHDRTLSAPMNECVKCGACKEACPSHAISFPLIPARTANGARATKGETGGASVRVGGADRPGAAHLDAGQPETAREARADCRASSPGAHAESASGKQAEGASDELQRDGCPTA